MGRGGCLGGRDRLDEAPQAFLEARGQKVLWRKAQGSLPKYTMEEVSQHNSPEDCWIVVKDRVLNVSGFGEMHPGGDVLYTHAGKLATDVFAVFHTSSTWLLLRQFCIGELVNDEPTPDLIKDFRALRETLQKAQLFESSKLFYALTSLSNLAMLAASFTLLHLSKDLAGVMLSASLLGLFWQQCGWLSHDFLHHQVFKSRALNNFIGGYLIGNLGQGFSMVWWKSKHNAHHAAPNECDHDFNAVDPDIDTIPFLAWDAGMLVQVRSRAARLFLRWQSYLFFPIILFARFAWLHSSWKFATGSQLSPKTRLLEIGTICLHYSWLLGSAFSLLPFHLAVTWLILSQLVSGALLSIVFVQSHNGMEIYKAPKDFYSAQIISTRDIHGGLFNDWFTGGLNRQIEHHLFPSLPRHNLAKISSAVKFLCKKHRLVFEDVDIATGTSLVIRKLAEVAAAV
eukprot:SM000277S10344  [mRNA]  locus=s277:76424:78965:- [translate_table: standard]